MQTGMQSLRPHMYTRMRMRVDACQYVCRHRCAHIHESLHARTHAGTQAYYFLYSTCTHSKMRAPQCLSTYANHNAHLHVPLYHTQYAPLYLPHTAGCRARLRASTNAPTNATINGTIRASVVNARLDARYEFTHPYARYALVVARNTFVPTMLAIHACASACACRYALVLARSSECVYANPRSHAPLCANA
jgi:hypothetical protein